MTAAQKVWTKSHNELHEQIGQVATIVTFDDGTEGILPGTAPTGLLARYARSTQVGYAKGWL